MKRIDLHVHSTRSDGTLSPQRLIRHAVSCGLSAVALTDHDNTDGLEEASQEAALWDVELVPGIEFSTEYQGKDIHIVGLDIHWQHPEFQHKVKYYREERLRRNQKMIDKMAADGIDISYQKMIEAFGETVWTRAHFARYLAEHNYVNEMSDAFKTHIGDDCKYFVPRQKVTPSEVVKLIRTFDGIPVLAHPFQYRFSDFELRTLLKTLKKNGLLGIEVYYSTHTPQQEAYLSSLAEEFGLSPSGGSDFHGSNKPDIALGSGRHNLEIPYSVLTNLRKALQEDN
ncbi:MAG: PHP domain-containing protein [bacterium]|nr:PHP domain-containing protein [bacterium]